MRMWMVDPKIMCRKHLLGEHVEHHMFIGTLKAGTSVAGYLAGNLMEPASLYSRHEQLAVEMEARGYNHKSPLPDVNSNLTATEFRVKIDKDAALNDLLSRCSECRARYEILYNK